MVSGFSVQDVLTLVATACSCKNLPYPEVTLGKYTMFSELNAVSIRRHRSNPTRFLTFQFSMLSYTADGILDPCSPPSIYMLNSLKYQEGGAQVINLLSSFKGKFKIALQSRSFKQGNYCSSDNRMSVYCPPLI